MSDRFNELSAKHRALLERCAVQRTHVGQMADDVQGRLGRVDRAVGIVRRLMGSPLIIVAGIAVVALIGPGRLLRLASRAAVVYPTVRRVAGMVRERQNPK
jgi:hypothetical protein